MGHFTGLITCASEVEVLSFAGTRNFLQAANVSFVGVNAFPPAQPLVIAGLGTGTGIVNNTPSNFVPGLVLSWTQPAQGSGAQQAALGRLSCLQGCNPGPASSASPSSSRPPAALPFVGAWQLPGAGMPPGAAGDQSVQTNYLMTAMSALLSQSVWLNGLFWSSDTQPYNILGTTTASSMLVALTQVNQTRHPH